jgi:hypothetical protein
LWDLTTGVCLAILYTASEVRVKKFIEHCYTIDMEDDGSNRQYFLNDEPHEYVLPENVFVGSMVYYDKLNENCGIVMNIRNDNYFQLYDVLSVQTEKIEEVVEFQVYRVSR